MEPDYRQQWFVGLAEPHLWRLTATQLAHAAELLWDRWKIAADSITDASRKGEPIETETLRDIPLCNIAFMLAGFALENILKGLCVSNFAKQGPIVEDDKRLKRLTEIHDPHELAQMAEITISQPHSELLDELYIEVLWGGRYPRPRKSSDFFPEIGGKPGEVKMRSFSQHDWDAFVALYKDLHLQLISASKGRSS